MKAKFETGTPVLVFKCPAFPHAGCGVITDRTCDQDGYAYEIRDIRDDDRLMWVKEEFLMKILLTKPTFIEKIKWLFGRI
jgi:hypothetical protein